MSVDNIRDETFDRLTRCGGHDVGIGLADPAHRFAFVPRVERLDLWMEKHLHGAHQPVLPVAPRDDRDP